MTSICFYFQVHQPFRIDNYDFFDIQSSSQYFDKMVPSSNQIIFNKVAQKCYIPTNTILLNLLESNPDFKMSLSLSGVFLEQAEKYNTDVIKLFKAMVDTGRCEILSETYHHSLAYIYSEEEFKKQVELHATLVKRLLGVIPKVFRNTELIYNNALAKTVSEMGYKAILAEGADHILDWRSPNHVYRPKGSARIALLLKNYKLSDDLAFRFTDKNWVGFPLTVEKYTEWINSINGSGEIINLFMDYETFGEHQWAESGILEFLKHLPDALLEKGANQFLTPSEVIDQHESVGEIDVHEFTSWADTERNLSAWIDNDMQRDSLHQLYDLEESVKSLNSEQILEDWRKLQTSDHFYYMSTKYWSDGDVHKYFSPFASPHKAYIYFSNALADLKNRIRLETSF